jgi:hypothetical protein
VKTVLTSKQRTFAITSNMHAVLGETKISWKVRITAPEKEALQKSPKTREGNTKIHQDELLLPTPKTGRFPFWCSKTGYKWTKSGTQLPRPPGSTAPARTHQTPYPRTRHATSASGPHLSSAAFTTATSPCPRPRLPNFPRTPDRTRSPTRGTGPRLGPLSERRRT